MNYLKAAALIICIVFLCSCGNANIIKTKEITNKISQQKVILESKIKETKDYGDFFYNFKESFIIPGLISGVIPQCACYDETTGYILMCGYYKNGEFPTVIITINPENNKMVNYYHLKDVNGENFYNKITGAAASQNTVYLTGNGNCYTFPATDLQNASESTYIQCKSKFKLNTMGAFATIENNTLWTGDCVNSNDKEKENYKKVTTLSSGETFYAYCEGYELKDGLPRINKINSQANGYIPDYMLAIPEDVHGMAFTKSNKIIFSINNGKFKDSKLIIYNDILMNEKSGVIEVDGKTINLLSCSSDEISKTITAPPMANALVTSPKGIYLIFESGSADKRTRCKNALDTAYITNLE